MSADNKTFGAWRGSTYTEPPYDDRDRCALACTGICPWRCPVLLADVIVDVVRRGKLVKS